VSSLTIDAAGELIAIVPDESVDDATWSVLSGSFANLVTTRNATARIVVSMSSERSVPLDGGFARGASAAQLTRSVTDVVGSVVLAAHVPDTSAGRAETLPDRVGIRASALSTAEGAVVLFGGPSRHAAITAMGGAAALVGSDVVLIDRRDRSVTGVAGLVNVGGTTLESSSWVSPETAGVGVTTDAVQLRALVFLDPVPDGESTWYPISTPEAVAMAAGSVPSLSAVKRPLVALTEVFDMASGAVVVRYRTPEDVPGLLADVLDQPAERTWAQPADTRAVEAARTPELGDVRRAAMLDAITDGTHMAFCTSQYAIVAAGGIAPMLWDAAADWIGLDDLTAGLVAAMGQPDGDAREFVSASVDALVDQGVLVRV